ncbi:type II toxin-antitoxin system RelE family toxin [Propionicicella superfundia]|uniref:type II toxin-antitoxin system RelE family toxin n=1 Tax=Propionicicella superfundia TaxID=348582 RepID=UPI000403B685|nr:type II toxin-antitoxin system RelE/ParE family toxin [Propionicicella superfundia]
MNPPNWTVETTSTFDRALRRLDRPVQARIIAYLHAVAELSDPRRRGRALTATHAGTWRYRVGDHRIIVQIVDERLTILALTTGHRSAIY